MVRLCGLVLALLTPGTLLASSEAVRITAQEAMNKLKEGNTHFVEGNLGQCQQTSAALREKLAKGQAPYAIVLTCSDSRLPPEALFDRTLGEIFVVRVAGNVPDPLVLGSIEYAAEHLGSPLIVVMGHERCGAVTATVDAEHAPEGNLGDIVKRIAPAVQKAKKEGKGLAKAELVEKAIDINVDLAAENLVKQSKVIRKLVEEKKVTIVRAKYDLDDGKVVFKE